MMKLVGFCMSLCLVGAAFMLFNGFSGGVNTSLLVSGATVAEGDVVISEARSRNLKETEHHSDFDGESSGGDVSLEDYRPFDPSPSSKASVKPGPIQHGTPLMPYLPSPKPSPPPRSSNHEVSP